MTSPVDYSDTLERTFEVAKLQEALINKDQGKFHKAAEEMEEGMTLIIQHYRKTGNQLDERADGLEKEANRWKREYEKCQEEKEEGRRELEGTLEQLDSLKKLLNSSIKVEVSLPQRTKRPAAVTHAATGNDINDHSDTGTGADTNEPQNRKRQPTLKITYEQPEEVDPAEFSTSLRPPKRRKRNPVPSDRERAEDTSSAKHLEDAQISTDLDNKSRQISSRPRRKGQKRGHH